VSNNSNGSAEIDQSLEKDIGANVRALKRNGRVFERFENDAAEISGDNLGTLLRRVSEPSTRQVESLISELHELRKKLEIDADRIQSDIVRYAELSQGVMQLTMIVSDNVKKIPHGPPAA
jgi:hypothetical protein